MSAVVRLRVPTASQGGLNTSFRIYTAEMNCPSPVHCPEGDGMNQNPNALSAALTTNQDLNGMVNLKVLKRLAPIDQLTEDDPFDEPDAQRDKVTVVEEGQVGEGQAGEGQEIEPSGPEDNDPRKPMSKRLLDVVMTFGKFVGPGFMVSPRPRVVIWTAYLPPDRSPWLTLTPGTTLRMWQRVPHTGSGFSLSC